MIKGNISLPFLIWCHDIIDKFEKGQFKMLNNAKTGLAQYLEHWSAD